MPVTLAHEWLHAIRRASGTLPGRIAYAALLLVSALAALWLGLVSLERAVAPDGASPPSNVVLEMDAPAGDGAIERHTVPLQVHPGYKFDDPRPRRQRPDGGVFKHAFVIPQGAPQQAFYVGFTARIVEVRLNNNLLSSQGHRSSWGLTSDFYPEMYILPDEHIRPLANEIEIRVLGSGVKALPPIYVGDANAIERATIWGRAIVIDLPAIALAVMVYVALLCALIRWPVTEQPRAAALVMLLTAWCFRNITHLGLDSLLPSPLQTPFYFLVAYGFLFALLQYVLVATGSFPNARRFVPAGWLGVSGGVILPLVFGAASIFSLALTIEAWLTLAICLFCAALLVFQFARAREGERRPIEYAILLICIGALAVDAFDDKYPFYLPFTDNLPVSYYLSPSLGILLALGVLVSLAVQASRAQGVLANMNSVLSARLQEKEAELKGIFALEKSVERDRVLVEERKRIMRDMHDGLGSRLFGIAADLRTRGGDRTGEAANGILEVIEELRLIVDSLDTAGDDLGFALGAFRARVEPKLKASGVDLTWNLSEEVLRAELGAGEVLEIFRILQEACTNTLRHANASRFSVSGERRAHFIEIEIADNGDGMPSAEKPGRGLGNMKARAEKIGGSLVVSPQPGGVRIMLRVPIDHDDEPERN